MSESKFTPGPWEANVEGNGDVFAGDLQIADCDWPQGEVKPETIGANAVLIAAAPDLLAACEELLDAYEDGTNQCCCENAGFASPAPCLVCRVRTAIAKAKGQ